MDDPNAPTRVMPAAKPSLQPAVATPSDYRFQVVSRGVAADYDLLGDICEVGEGSKGGVAYLAMRKTSGRLDALRLVSAADYVEVIGRVGEVLPVGDTCPKCGSPVRGGVRYCGSCRTNLAAIKLTDGRNSPSIAEWLEIKAEAGRNGYEVLGHADARQLRIGTDPDSPTKVFLGRLAGTSKITALTLERGTDGAPAVLSVDQTRILPDLIGALIAGPEPAPTPVAPIPVVRNEIPTPPPPAPEPVAPPSPQPAPVAEIQPVPPVPPTADWVRFSVLGLSAAAVIAAVAWLVSSISSQLNNRQASTTQPPRVDSSQTVVSVPDSATLEVGGSLPTDASITVDNIPVSGTSVRLPAGSHVVVLSAPGYRATTDTVQLTPRQQAVLTPRLEREAKRPPEPATPKASVASCADAARRSDWSQAFKLCSKDAAAKKGTGFAERTLGMMYARGLGVTRDPDASLEWYSEAAYRGDAVGEYHFGDALEHGTGVRADHAEAAKWYTKAAEQGNADAQLALGLLYAKGDGVRKSEPDAIKWFQRAAAAGNGRAKQELSQRGIRP